MEMVNGNPTVIFQNIFNRTILHHILLKSALLFLKKSSGKKKRAIRYFFYNISTDALQIHVWNNQIITSKKDQFNGLKQRIDWDKIYRPNGVNVGLKSPVRVQPVLSFIKNFLSVAGKIVNKKIEVVNLRMLHQQV